MEENIDAQIYKRGKLLIKINKACRNHYLDSLSILTEMISEMLSTYGLHVVKYGLHQIRSTCCKKPFRIEIDQRVVLD